MSRVRDVAFLESGVNQLAEAAKIDPEAWKKFMAHMAGLKEHHLETYLHCLRVGAYSFGLAEMEKWQDLKYPLFGGCGHDDGKCEVEQVLLGATGRLTEEEFNRIKKHTREGFNRLKESFLFTAFIAGMHHKFQDKGYGIDLDRDSPVPLSDESKEMVRKTAVLVMTADFFDALTTRSNNKGLIDDPSDPAKQAEVMTQFFPETPARVAWLVENRIK